MDIPFSFLVQTSSLYLLHDLKAFLWVFAHWPSCQRYKSTYGSILVPVSLLLLLILLPSLPYSRVPILLLLFILSYFSLSLVFFLFLFSLASHFFPSSSFFSLSFCFCHSDFPCFGLYYLPHSFGHLVILTSPVLQLISGLWQASHSISKITFHFCSLILFFLSVPDNKYLPLPYILLVPPY